MEKYTISMMFRANTFWNVYAIEDGLEIINYAAGLAGSDENYASLYTALLAQHQVLGQVEIAFPLKVIERFDIERLLLKKKGEAPSSEYTSIRNLALGGAVRGTNGEEIHRSRLAALGLAAANG